MARNSEQLVDRLVHLVDNKPAGFRNRQGFSVNTARIWVRAKFRCEYCDESLLDGPIAYGAYQYDHLLPLSKYPKNKFLAIDLSTLWGSRRYTDEELRNLALSCSRCNRTKSNFDANRTSKAYSGQGTLSNNARAQLIAVVRKKLKPRSEETREMVELVSRLWHQYK